MAINFTQTDTLDTSCTGSERVGCSGLADGSPSSLSCSDGGTAGSTPIIVNVAGSAANSAEAFMVCTVASGVTWAAGTWTVRLNVTTSNMNLTWSSVYICRAGSDCVNAETIGSATGLGISLGSTGVKSTTVSGSATSPSAGDQVTVVFGLDSGSMSLASFQYTPNQNIDSPFTAAVDDLAPQILM